MAGRIEFNGTGDGWTDKGIHFEGLKNDYTLCGITLDGDERTAGGYNVTNKKVDCEDCIRIIEFSKNVKRSEYV